MRVVALAVLVVAACSGYDDLPLLDMESIDPPEIEPGTTIRIRGNGFPLGRSPSIELRGDVYRPGMPAGELDATLVGHVRSESLIELPITAEQIESLGGRMTFDGDVRVGFRTEDGLRDVFAIERARIDFLPETASQLRESSAGDEVDGAAAALAFGVELSKEELGTAGVRVASVHGGSLAAKQGVKAGDAIIALDGVNVYAWRDFVPDPSRTESRVLVSREGLRGIHALRWPHARTEPGAASVGLGIFVLLGLFLGWASPIALTVRARFDRSPAATWTIQAALVLVFSVVMVGLPAVQWASLWIFALGTFAALYSLATRDRAGTASFALAVGSTLSVMLLAGTASIPDIVASQGPELFRWIAVRSPASLLAVAAFVHALGSLASSSRLSASLYLAPTAVLGASLFLGGWPLASMPIAVLVLAAKSLSLLAAARAFAIRPRTAAALCAGAIGLALLGFVVDLGAVTPEWAALCAGLFAALGVRVIVPSARRISEPTPA